MKQSQWTIKVHNCYVFHRGYGVSTNCCNYRMVLT